jgi:2,6-dihydroxypseudooxynicotine hydrolase
MSRDPMVDLIFSHFTPRYVATGVDPNDLRRLVERIERWDDWCSTWSDEARRHEQHAAESAALGRRLTAAESHLRAAIYYHYAKHLFAAAPDAVVQDHDAVAPRDGDGARAEVG